jgi:hypothetical protein
MEMQDVVTTVSGNPIKVEDIIVHLKVNGAFRNTIYQLIENRVVALKCRELNIGISDNEFYAHADTKRRMLGPSPEAHRGGGSKGYDDSTVQPGEELIRRTLKVFRDLGVRHRIVQGAP